MHNRQKKKKKPQAPVNYNVNPKVVHISSEDICGIPRVNSIITCNNPDCSNLENNWVTINWCNVILLLSYDVKRTV